jgi:hypothetical protein
MTAFDYFSPENDAFRALERFRRPMIEKVFDHYSRGLITSVELMLMMADIAEKEPPPLIKQVTLTVTVNLDSVPGTFHTVESARESVQTILNDRIPHYKPAVNVQEA